MNVLEFFSNLIFGYHSSDTPIKILPLSSLLIFSSIGLLSFSIGFTLIQSRLLNKNDVAINNSESLKTQTREINREVASNLANCFLSLSEKSAITTLIIFFSASLFSLDIKEFDYYLKLFGFFLKLFVFIFLGKSFFQLFIYLLKLRSKINPEIKDFEDIQKYLNKANP